MLCVKGEDELIIEKVVSFVFELVKCDVNYDVRDRVRVLIKILFFFLNFYDFDVIGVLLKEVVSFIVGKIFVVFKGLLFFEFINDCFYFFGFFL